MVTEVGEHSTFPQLPVVWDRAVQQLVDDDVIAKALIEVQELAVEGEVTLG